MIVTCKEVAGILKSTFSAQEDSTTKHEERLYLEWLVPDTVIFRYSWEAAMNFAGMSVFFPLAHILSLSEGHTSFCCFWGWIYILSRGFFWALRQPPFCRDRKCNGFTSAEDTRSLRATFVTWNYRYSRTQKWKNEGLSKDEEWNWFAVCLLEIACRSVSSRLLMVFGLKWIHSLWHVMTPRRHTNSVAPGQCHGRKTAWTVQRRCPQHVTKENSFIASIPQRYQNPNSSASLLVDIMLKKKVAEDLKILITPFFILFDQLTTEATWRSFCAEQTMAWLVDDDDNKGKEQKKSPLSLS